MNQLPEDTTIVLADAQIAEKNGDWLNAIEKREVAVSGLLGRPPVDPKPRTTIKDDKLLVTENDLEELANVYTPSKRGHDYIRRYWSYFRDIRESARKVVEVGVQTPRSIEMWEEFFPNAMIYGIDIDPACAEFSGGRKKVFIGDQMDQKFLMQFVSETGGDFDVVIDDGLHTDYSMLKTFSFLYPALHSHGIYVIEDIHQKPDIITFLRGIMDCINYIPQDFDLRDWPKLNSFPGDTPWLIRNTAGLSFHRFIAFIERGFNPQDNPYLVDPALFDQKLVEKREAVLEGVRALQSKGTPVTREALMEHLGRLMYVHIDRYLSELKKG